MKFGVLQFFSWPERRIPLPEVYARALQRIDVMDKTGYDAVWLAEHHFNTFSVCPSVHVMGAHVAARTQTLRIGTAVTLAAMYQPLRIAEEIALIDVLSGGRVNWGAGRGFDATEFRAFGVPGANIFNNRTEKSQPIIFLKIQQNVVEVVTSTGAFPGLFALGHVLAVVVKVRINLPYL